ncbi:MAG TPA: hypothetical protein DHW82_02270 [Spirochaetia bacterium]|nr:MAG: hypothetical protein A2Y41_03540 [Spirochaetes bacterium GWB1_36_13]HCL55819.1 hypothetical protein [Spirochaetia bacterium]
MKKYFFMLIAVFFIAVGTLSYSNVEDLGIPFDREYAVFKGGNFTFIFLDVGKVVVIEAGAKPFTADYEIKVENKKEAKIYLLKSEPQSFQTIHKKVNKVSKTKSKISKNKMVFKNNQPMILLVVNEETLEYNDISLMREKGLDESEGEEE